MKTALEKAQEEYKRRINDPSYVAPEILRSNERKKLFENPKGESEEVEIVPFDEIQEDDYLARLEMLKKKIMQD